MTAFAALADLPSPLLPHGHTALCAECEAVVRLAAGAVVGEILHTMRPGCRGQGDRGWSVLARIAASPGAVLVAADYLAELVEAGACGHVRDRAGTPLIERMVSPAAPELEAFAAEHITVANTYLKGRTVARATGVPELVSATVVAFTATGKHKHVLALLALAAASAELHPLGGEGRHGRAEVPGTEPPS